MLGQSLWERQPVQIGALEIGKWGIFQVIIAEVIPKHREKKKEFFLSSSMFTSFWWSGRAEVLMDDPLG